MKEIIAGASRYSKGVRGNDRCLRSDYASSVIATVSPVLRYYRERASSVRCILLRVRSWRGNAKFGHFDVTLGSVKSLDVSGRWDGENRRDGTVSGGLTGRVECTPRCIIHIGPDVPGIATRGEVVNPKAAAAIAKMHLRIVGLGSECRANEQEPPEGRRSVSRALYGKERGCPRGLNRKSARGEAQPPCMKARLILIAFD